MTDAEIRTLEILKDKHTFNERGGELVTGNVFGDKLMTPEEEADATMPKKAPRKPRAKKVIPDHSNQVDMFEATDMHEKFLLFLESLRTNSNAPLIESICEGFDVIFEATLAPIDYEGDESIMLLN